MTIVSLLFLLLAFPALAFTGDTSDVDATIPRSNCSVTTSTYCVVDADCPAGQSCVHQAVLSAPMRSNFSTAKTELGQLKANKADGAASSTDNALVRFDGTSGKVVQNSGCLLADSGQLACTTSSGGSAGLSVLYGGAGNVATLTTTGGSGLSISSTGAPTFSYSGTGTIRRNDAGNTVQILDADGDGWTFGENASLSSSNSDILVSQKNALADGPGNYAVSLANRTFTPDINGHANNDWYTHIKNDSLDFDLKNASSTSAATVRALSLNAHLRATGGVSKSVAQGGRFIMLDSVQDIESTVSSYNGQLFNIVNEIRFQGPLSLGGGVPATHMVSHPLGMTTSATNRTSGAMVFTNIGYYGNDADAAGPLRVLTTDYVNGLFMAPVEGPSGSGTFTDDKIMPLFIACKTANDSPTCKGRSWHQPSITFGSGPSSYSDPISIMTATGFTAANEQIDAIVNVAAANIATGISTSVVGMHVFDQRNSSTASIDKTLLKLDGTSSWSGSGARVIGSDIFVTGGTTNIAARYGTTGNAKLNVIPATTTLTCSSGSTCTWSSAIPDGATVRSVTARVNTAISGCTSIDIGDGSDVDMWGATIGTTLGTTTTSADYTTASAVGLRTAATNVVITCNGGTFTAGVVRLTAIYDTDTAASA